MEILVWIGAVISLIGLVGLMVCIVIVARAKRAKLEDALMRAKLARVIPLNLGALLLSVLGLMLVIVGIFLG